MHRYDEDEVERKVASLYKYLDGKYAELGQGCYRSTFEFPGGKSPKVIKCPNSETICDIEDNGIKANLIEYYLSKKYAHLNIFPKVTLVWYNGIPCVIMERLDSDEFEYPNSEKPLENFEKILKRNKIELCDGEQQCGIDKHGKVLCYDFANEFDLINPKLMKKIDSQTVSIYKELSKVVVKLTKKNLS